MSPRRNGGLEAADVSASAVGPLPGVLARPVFDTAATVEVPVEALRLLVRVAQYVSLGRRAVDRQPDGAPYPDADARFGLGALPDCLLEQLGAR